MTHPETVTTGSASSPAAAPAPVEVFSTCAASNFSDRDRYLEQVVNVSRWSEQAGCKGILVYTDNGLVDPWLASQVVIQSTRSLCPLVAVQPVYMHPYSVAKLVTTLGFLHHRRVYLNMVAGGFKNDLLALNDQTPHDKRYDRLVEYTNIITKLCAGGPVTCLGEFYKVENLKLTPPLPPELMPGVFVSGSSEAGLAAARRMEALAVQYPEPVSRIPVVAGVQGAFGVRVGIIARPNNGDAWSIALQRFPEDRKGQLTHQLAMKVSDSQWHKQLSEAGKHQQEHEQNGHRDVYWLGPFENYKTFCPYLVGTYEEVAGYLGHYVTAGYRTFILDIPATEEEIQHVNLVFDQVYRRAA